MNAYARFDRILLLLVYQQGKIDLLSLREGQAFVKRGQTVIRLYLEKEIIIFPLVNLEAM